MSNLYDPKSSGHTPDPTEVFIDTRFRAVQIKPPPENALGRIFYLRVRVREALHNGEYVVASCNKDGSNVDGARQGYFVQPSELIAGPVVAEEMGIKK